MNHLKKVILIVSFSFLLASCGSQPVKTTSASSIENEFSTKGLINPQTITLADGAHYIGEIEGGKPSGHGKLTYPNSIIYIGEFKNGAPNGAGKLQSSTGRYTGIVKNGKPNGFGLSNNNDGSTYEGEHVKGVFQGRGKLTLSDGSFFIGYFKDNKVGKGVMVFTDGREIPMR